MAERINTAWPHITRKLEKYIQQFAPDSPLEICTFHSPTTCPQNLWRDCPIRKGSQCKNLAEVAERRLIFLHPGMTNALKMEQELPIRNFTIDLDRRCNLELELGVDISLGTDLPYDYNLKET